MNEKSGAAARSAATGAAAGVTPEAAARAAIGAASGVATGAATGAAAFARAATCSLPGAAAEPEARELVAALPGWWGEHRVTIQ